MSASNLQILVGLVFLLLFVGFLLSQYSLFNASIKCPEQFNATSQSITDYLPLLFNQQCSGISPVISFLFYVPVLIGIIREIVSLSS